MYTPVLPILPALEAPLKLNFITNKYCTLACVFFHSLKYFAIQVLFFNFWEQKKKLQEATSG
jgi:hypothetical protein